MLKKRLYTALSVIFCCFTAGKANAQLTISLPEANISGQTDYKVNINTGASPFLSLISAINANAGAASLSPTPSTLAPVLLAPNLINMKITSIGGSIGVLGGTTQIVLSNTPQNIYYVLLALLSGTILVDYTVSSVGVAWAAGSYATTLTLTGGVNPASQTLTIVIPAYVTLNTLIPATTALNVNSFAFFRNSAGISAPINNDYFTTVPTQISLRATSSVFSFTTTQPYNQLPATNNVSLMSALLTGAYSGPAINLSAADQLLTTSTGIPVQIGNKDVLTPALSISGANLSSNFVQAGTYSAPVVYTVAKTASSFPATPISKTMNSTAQVNVSNMMELVVPDPNVTLTVSTTANYQQGVTTTKPGHIKVSSTVPYNVTVKASSNFLSSAGGAQIPVGVITIEGMTGQTGIQPIVLSSAPQVIISSANPVIDRLLNLQYRIPATQTSNLLNKTAGSYSTTVTYSIVAP
ncbi:hypothetical protein HDE68_002473 [Pedobacter cryoconitis]|uniref:Uncharacterized protein n=1 Tax=Pedobacter cryoconitis TaxID=188932 RepID=A0A7W8ZML9_9SPHI|nr:hypothetical protein [Pedobacter cryoconitis]MBB5636572.1 hypothetical protein [Pedobacter cryoconitis]